ncbi:histidine kinase dimerization/phosphoacceptor domain -containing protein [Marinoscillum furvescens]|uniref:histidine kinase n=1 Tax=Marinoscillum furvescens DSM 4134 TaxID=1122208 RepID=A0A3D9LH05_MARFU|nr:histidine kinase dimerization/phosphoacceptor domain -containing protein [Marinoscillum furvescens]REE05754.1 two-component sensor histidine kinase [Marinoscillum furvescens DSM 4134]
MYKYLSILAFAACMACEPTIPPHQNKQVEVDSLNQFILNYFEDNFGYDRGVFLQIKSTAEQLINEGYQSAELPHLVSSGLLAFMNVHQIEAIELYLEALAVAEKYDHTLYIGTLHQEIAKIHFGMRSFEKALNYETEASKIWEELGLSKRTGHSLNYQGMMYNELGDTERAIRHYTRALRIFESINDPSSILPTLDQIAKAHLKANRPDSSIYFFQRAYEHSLQLPEFWQMKALQGLGQGYMRTNNNEEAKKYLTQGLAIAERLNDVEAAFFLMDLGKILAEENKNDEALPYLEASLRTFDTHQITHYQSYLHELLAPIYEAKGDFVAAYQSLKKFIPLNDSIAAKNNKEHMARLTAEYESEKKDIRIDLQETEIKSQNQIQYALLGGLGALLCITGLITKYYLEKRESNQKIEQQNAIISKSLEERESLLKEIHHRVKNNLQIIASLLYLQSGKFENEDFKKVLEDGQGRVRSMALIHQKLYENEDLKSIPFGEYLNELLTEIKHSFGSDGDKVNLQVEAEDIHFDVEVAVPLGLIVNELATNAFKYAFADKDSGVFSISLKKQGEEFVLRIADNGKGLPEEIDIRKTRSLGLRLVNMLSNQLEGSFEIHAKKGTEFKLNFAA